MQIWFRNVRILFLLSLTGFSIPVIAHADGKHYAACLNIHGDRIRKIEDERIRIDKKYAWYFERFLDEINTAAYEIKEEDLDRIGAIPADSDGRHRSFFKALTQIGYQTVVECPNDATRKNNRCWNSSGEPILATFEVSYRGGILHSSPHLKIGIVVQGSMYDREKLFFSSGVFLPKTYQDNPDAVRPKTPSEAICRGNSGAVVTTL